MKALLLTLSFVASVVAANIVTSNWGLVSADFGLFGLLVPAGTYFAGMALVLRDAVQEWADVRWVWVAIATGTVLSYLLADPRIALASGVAFVASEALDLSVYTWLRERGWRRALVASNVVGAVADTLLFLWLSGFGITTQAVGGQLLVKVVWVTGSALVLTEVVRRAVLRQRQLPASA